MVKITKSLKSSPHLVDEVLYARRQLPYLVKEKYMSYFETLHAMAKMMYSSFVCNYSSWRIRCPRRKSTSQSIRRTC